MIDETLPKGWWRIIHSKPHGCGGIAFYCKDKPVKGLPAYAGAYKLIDGHAPEEGDLATCGNCQAPINPKKLNLGECSQVE